MPCNRGTLWLEGLMMKLDFEWDDEKAKENERKHKVDFEEASPSLVIHSHSLSKTPIIQLRNRAISTWAVLRAGEFWS